MRLLDKLIPKADDSHEFKPILAEIEDCPINPIGNTIFWLIVIFIVLRFLVISVNKLPEKVAYFLVLFVVI